MDKSFLLLFFKKEALSFLSEKKKRTSFLKKRSKKLLSVWFTVAGPSRP
jgi:hypothetical protein